MRIQIKVLALLLVIGGACERPRADVPSTVAARRDVLGARSETLDMNPPTRAVIARAPIWRAQKIGELVLIPSGVVSESFYQSPAVMPGLTAALEHVGLRLGMTTDEVEAYREHGQPPEVTLNSSFAVLNLPSDVRRRLSVRYAIQSLAELVKMAPGFLLNVHPLNPTAVPVLEHELRMYRLPGDQALLSPAEWEFIAHVRSTRARQNVRDELVARDVRTFERLAEVVIGLTKKTSALPSYFTKSCARDFE